MEKAMRPLTVIAGMLMLSGPALADPSKQASPAQPGARPAVVLASADTVRTPAQDSAQPTSAPAKRRVARVTTCRCGDPQPDPESQEQ
jgi:hypothetical protein